jgi:hypothetical protein
MGFAMVLSLAVAASSVAQTKGGATTGTAADKPAAGTTTTKTPAKTPAKTTDAKKADAGASTTATAAGDAGASTGATSLGDAGVTPTGAASPSVPGAAPTMDGSTYQVRLRDLESRVDELKDQIRRSHTRLALLSDTIMTGGIAGSRAEIVFKNEMSSAFRLVRATVTLDGAVQYNRQDDTGALAEQKEIPVYTGSVPPGDHTVGVKLTFQGNGYGVFTYLKSYRWEVPGNHSFTAVEGKAMKITVTSLERGGVTTPLNERPALQWQEEVQALGAQPAAAAPASGGGGGASGGASGNANVGGGNASGGFSIGGGTK